MLKPRHKYLIIKQFNQKQFGSGFASVCLTNTGSFMRTKQPVPKEVAIIVHRQKKRLSELNALDKWTETEFEEVIHCSNEWDPHQQGWIFPLSAIEKLAFDARTPDKQARSLQLIAKYMSLDSAK
jgi:hypothetical protein